MSSTYDQGNPPTPTAELVLELKPAFANFYEPKVVIDGRVLPARWHTNVYTVPAGTRRIEVSTERLVWNGKAIFLAEVPAGERTVVHYTGPASKFSAGVMGYVEQPRPGRWVWFLIAGLIVLLVVMALAIVWVAITFAR